MAARAIAKGVRRLLIYVAYLAISMVAIYFMVEWAHGRVLNAAMKVPTVMRAAKQTRTALTPTPGSLPASRSEK